MKAEDLRAAAAALEGCRWARVGECAVASRCAHVHAAPGDGAVGVHLGCDAGINLYGAGAPDRVLHVDVLHVAGLCRADALRGRLLAAARAYREARTPEGRRDDPHLLLRWVEARADTADEAPEQGPPAARPAADGGGPAAASGHVHLAFRLGEVPLDFVPLAVEAAEDAILDSGLALVGVAHIEPTWEALHRPPCSCGTGRGPAAAGSREAWSGPSRTGWRSSPGGPAPDAQRAARTRGGAGATAGSPFPAAAAAALTAAPRTGRPTGAVQTAGWPPPALPTARPPAALQTGGSRRASRPEGAPARTARSGGSPEPGGNLLSVETAVAAAARPRPGVWPAPRDLRYAPPRVPRPPDLLLALDRSPSMAARLPAICAFAEGAARASPARAVGLYALRLEAPSGPGAREPGQTSVPRGRGAQGCTSADEATAATGWRSGAAAIDLEPTRDRRALRAALKRARAEDGPGESDLAAGLRVLAARLRAHPPRRRAVCLLFTDGLATGAGDPFGAAAAAAGQLRGLRRVRMMFCGWAPAGPRLRALARAAGGRARVWGEGR